MRAMRTQVVRRQFLRLLVGSAGVLAAASCGPATPAAPTQSAPSAAQPTAAAAAKPTVAPTAAPASAPQPTAPPKAAAAPTQAAPAAAGASTAGIKTGGSLVIADFSDQKTLDPAFINTTPMRNIGRALYDTLVDIDLNGNYVPVLAERWETPDPRTWLLYLRKGVKYADGSPFDAEVVKFNIDRHLDPKTKSRQIGELLSI